MSKHFDRVNNRTRAVQLSTYTDNRPTVYRMDEPVQADNGEAQGYDSLLGYWHILVRNKVTLLCFALAGLALAVLFSLLQTPIYRARTSLEIQDFNSEFMDLKNVDPTNTGPGTAMDSYFQTQIKILQSDSLLERVAKAVFHHDRESSLARTVDMQAMAAKVNEFARRLRSQRSSIWLVKRTS